MNKLVQKYTYNKAKITCLNADRLDDLLILSASFEDRCTAVSERFSQEYSCENAFVFYNKEFLHRGKTKINLNKITKQLRKLSHQTNNIETSLISNPNIIAAFHEHVTGKSIKFEGGSVTIDISTFPRQELLLLLRYIKMLNSDGKVRILYTSPLKYGSWQSKGIKEIITVPSFAGTQIPGRKKLLVILAGFEEERMIKLWEEHEPSKTILVIGDPPTSKQFLRINKMKSRMIYNRSNVIESQASARDPFVFCSDLENILNQYKRDYNIFISPMNTKIQTVGLFLLFEKYNWFQITLAMPNDYNVKDYSSGARDIYEFYI
jgi:hypothetical protein